MTNLRTLTYLGTYAKKRKSVITASSPKRCVKIPSVVTRTAAGWHSYARRGVRRASAYTAVAAWAVPTKRPTQVDALWCVKTAHSSCDAYAKARRWLNFTVHTSNLNLKTQLGFSRDLKLHVIWHSLFFVDPKFLQSWLTIVIMVLLLFNNDKLPAVWNKLWTSWYRDNWSYH